MYLRNSLPSEMALHISIMVRERQQRREKCKKNNARSSSSSSSSSREIERRRRAKKKRFCVYLGRSIQLIRIRKGREYNVLQGSERLPLLFALLTWLMVCKATRCQVESSDLALFLSCCVCDFALCSGVNIMVYYFGATTL